jgi:hypothetical protein
MGISILFIYGIIVFYIKIVVNKTFLIKINMKKVILCLVFLCGFLACSSEDDTPQVIAPIATPKPLAKFTITFSATEGGSVSSTGGEYEQGQTVSVTATPQGEYLFTNWSDGNTDATRTVTIDATKTITANFEKKKYPLTVNIEGEGEVLEEIVNAGKTTDYNSGTTVKLTAVAFGGLDFIQNNGWDFVGWSGAVTSKEQVITVSVGETISITAIFKQKAFPHGINWDNVINNADNLSEIVYHDTYSTIVRNKLIAGYNDTPYKKFRGPNLEAKHFVSLDLWLDDLFALYAKAVRTDTQTFIMFPFIDLEWAVALLSNPEVNHPSYETIMRNANKTAAQGTRQNAVPNQPQGRLDGIWVLPATLGPDSNGGNGSLEINEETMLNHEFGHQIQQAQWKDENLNGPLRGMGRDAPCFLIEGIVSIPELALIYNTPEAYKNNIRRRIRGAYTSDPNTRDELGNFTGYQQLTEEVTYEFALNYLKDSFGLQCNSGLYYGLSYTLGYLATEALAAIGGVESPLALFTLMGKYDKTWEEAFLEVYRIPWTEAEPILAEYIHNRASLYRN